jgi:hypothetical protein
LLVVVITVFGGLTQAAAQEPPAPGIVGVYRCTGFNPDGSMYSAVVEIFKIENTYRVLWMLPDDTFVLGVGILTGYMLSVSYYGGSPAIVVYRTEGDQLDGKWTVGGLEGETYSETLTRLPGHPSLRIPAPARQQPSRTPDRTI